MTRAPLVMAKPSAAFPRGEQTMYDTTLGWRFTNPRLADAYYPYSMGETAENVVEQCGVSREDQDAFALDLAAALEGGAATPVASPMRSCRSRSPTAARRAPSTTDEHPRPDATLESLATLKPAFKRDASGSVTAGNSSGINDGAAAVLVMSRVARPRARAAADGADGGQSPSPASTRPRWGSDRSRPRGARSSAPGSRSPTSTSSSSTRRSRRRRCRSCASWGSTRRRPTSTAARSRSAIRLGASGARLTATLLHEMRRRGARYGLATMCIGVGQGIAAVFEAVE